MAENQPILSVSGLRIAFHDKETFTAVKDISFSINKGETLAIVGESGSGKSLTALAMMGLLPRSATMTGEIVLNTPSKNYQVHTTQANEWQHIRGKQAGMVFQEPMSSLNPIMTIGKQLLEAILIHQNITKKEAQRLAISWLERVQLPNPEKIYDRYPHQLSGGQKQRVMIAMAMCNHPVLLIADEPTTALDVTVQKEIIQLMQYLQEEHQTAMIFITHDLALAANIADKMLVMYQGEAVEYGTATEVLNHPKEAYTRALLASRPSPEHKNKKLPTVADFLNNTLATEPKEYTNHISDDVLLQADQLCVWFPEEKNLLGKAKSYFKAVNDVSFNLKKGEILGLVGESGCGKSTLSRAVMGLIPIHSGSIHFNNNDLSQLSAKEWRGIRKDIQMIFQDPYASLNPRMTIGDMLAEPLLTHHIVSRNEVKKETERLLDIVHLPKDALQRYPHQFSGGQRQRIGIARALSLRPQLIICDESVSALDVSIQAQILNLLKELQSEFNLSYLFISHDLSVVHYISNRVMVMETGQIVESGEATQVLKHPVNDYTKRLIAAMP